MCGIVQQNFLENSTMKIACQQENLSRGLSIVGRAVSTRSTLPVLANVLLASDGGRLKLSATNLEMVMTCWINAKVEAEGAITVPARTFTDLVGQLPNSSGIPCFIAFTEKTTCVHECRRRQTMHAFRIRQNASCRARSCQPAT